MLPDNGSTPLDEFDLPENNTQTQLLSPESDDLLVVPYRPENGGPRLVPATIAILLALGVMGYRVAQPDWHWAWPGAKPTPAHALPRLARTEAQPRGVDPSAGPTKPTPAPRREAKAKTEAAKPADAAADAKAAIDEIQKEADRIRAQREELAKIKEREGEKIAAAPKPPGPRGRNAVAQARQQARMGRLMRENLAEQQQRVEAMMRAQREFLARNGFDAEMGRFADRFGPEFADVDRAFERMRREMDAFDREALALLRKDDAPNPPAPALGPNGFELPQGQRQVRRFNFVDKNGNRVTGFQMRWSE